MQTIQTQTTNVNDLVNFFTLRSIARCEATPLNEEEVSDLADSLLALTNDEIAASWLFKIIQEVSGNPAKAESLASHIKNLYL